MATSFENDYERERRQHLLTARTTKLSASSLLGLEVTSKFDPSVFLPRLPLGLGGFSSIDLLIVISLDNLSKASAATVALQWLSNLTGQPGDHHLQFNI